MSARADRRGLVIFDCDGTLFAADTVTLPAVQIAFQRRGWTPPAEDRIRSFIGKPAHVFQAWLKALIPAGHAEGISADIDRVEMELVRNGARLYYGVPEALACIRATVQAMAICTNGPADYVAAVAETFGFRETFDLIRHWEKEGDAKAGMVADVLARLPARPALVVGDRPDDIQAAHANGLPAVGVTYGMSAPDELEEADALVGSPAELPAVVTRLLNAGA